MPGFRSTVDPDGLQEFSVVFTDRSLNHMSAKFQAVMRDISATLREVYAASGVALVPGGGSYAMEAVARQFAQGGHALILRNGYFSYRWSQIFDAGGFAGQRVNIRLGAGEVINQRFHLYRVGRENAQHRTPFFRTHAHLKRAVKTRAVNSAAQAHRNRLEAG